MRLPLARTTLVLAFGLASALATTPVSSQSVPRSWMQDAVDAGVAYADKKLQDELQKRARATIKAQYKKLLKAGADPTYARALGDLALSASEIDSLSKSLAQAWHSGDTDALRDASNKVSLAMGKQLTKGLSDPALRGHMRKALGSVDTVNQMATVLGSAAGGDPQAAAEFIGKTLIALTPGANVFSAAQTAIGVMRYAGGQFRDWRMEDLYADFASGQVTADDLRMRMTLAGNAWIVRDQMSALRAQKTEDLRLAIGAADDALIAHLTQVSENDIIDSILTGFEARKAREAQERQNQAAAERARADAAEMINQLVMACQDAPRCQPQPPGTPDSFLDHVRRSLERDPVLSLDDQRDQRAMSRLIAVGIAHGTNSDAYRQALADFDRYRNVVAGIDGRNFVYFQGGLTGVDRATLRLHVEGGQVRGRITGTFQGDSVTASFSGHMRGPHTFSLPLSGNLVDMSDANLGNFPFTGQISGTRTATDGFAGEWSASNRHGQGSGTWSATGVRR
ncbi:MAG: hypothetical protein EA407_02830 [Rhodobacteraceae bacterium]|nr:MAG: hypothetical protein EA407_02830 [Paracoccaceae bacterium]